LTARVRLRSPGVAAEQRFRFDEVAELYERARPRYPAALVEDLIALGRVPARGRILEIGSGTGLATRPFAERGFRVLGLEPGARMAALARAALAGFPDVAFAQTTFEDWPLEPASFDLVMAAQSFHWVDPRVRFTKTADALRPGGALAVFGNAPLPERSALHEAIDRVYAAHAPALAGAPASWYATDPLSAACAASGRYGPIEMRAYPWTRSYAAGEYVDLLRTHSNHRMLEEGVREGLHAAVREVIEAYGGSIDVRYEARLYLARRR
jgi:SAM-dependent methyltransferase